tara:strand:+ start:161 stop:853 length:693 start_codon:yes stop_codon:yes gene_type:complete
MQYQVVCVEDGYSIEGPDGFIFYCGESLSDAEWNLQHLLKHIEHKESNMKDDQFETITGYTQIKRREKKSIFKMCDILYDMIDDAQDPEHPTTMEDVQAYIDLDIESKLDNMVYVIKEKESRSKALLEDSKVKREEARVLQNSADRIKEIMIDTLEQRGVKELLGETCKIRIRKHGGKEPLLIEDEDLLEDKWFKPRVLVDKSAIREALQAGESIPGCSFGERGRGLTIK